MISKARIVDDRASSPPAALAGERGGEAPTIPPSSSARRGKDDPTLRSRRQQLDEDGYYRQLVDDEGIEGARKCTSTDRNVSHRPEESQEQNDQELEEGQSSAAALFMMCPHRPYTSFDRAALFFPPPP